MLGTILIYGADIKKRTEKFQELLSNVSIPTTPNPDLFILELEKDKKSIGIKEVKNAISWLADRPFSAPNKSLVIPEAEKLTLDAQNTLLKTLEEPPTKTLIILCTKKAEDLIPTVISRCRKIPLTTDTTQVTQDFITLPSLLKLNLAEKLEKSLEISKLDKQEAIDLLSQWETDLHNNLLKIDKAEAVNAYNLVREVRQNLEKTNGSLKFAIDYLVTHI